MSMLKVACEDQRLYLVESTTIASGGVNETRVLFNFCPMWDGYVKTAVFYQNIGDAYYAKVSTDNTALIPWEVTRNPGFMYFGVFGVKDGVSRTSEVMGVRIVPGAITAEIVPAEPTPDIYIQFLSEYAIIREMMVSVEQNTAASADNAKQSETNAKQSETNASASEIHVGNMKTEVETLVNGFDTHVGNMETEVSEFAEECKTEIGNFKDGCKTEIDTLADTRKNEIDNFTEECKTELDNYINASGMATINDVRKAAPRNLLDNSNFRNPVNQREQDSYTSGGYAIDRWKFNDSGIITVKENFVNFASKSGASTYLIQYIEDGVIELGETYTFGVYFSDGTKGVVSGVLNTNMNTLAQNFMDNNGNQFTLQLGYSENLFFAQMMTNIVSGHDIEWFSLYKGEYTVETLPEYQPKGYGAEFAECLRYYAFGVIRARSGNAWSLANSAFTFPIPMRVAPTATIMSPSTGDIGVADMWDGKNVLVPMSVHSVTNQYVRINSPTGKMKEDCDISADIALSADL